MTQQEYQRLYREAHARSGRITASTRRELLRSFKEAADLASAQVKRSVQSELSDITSKSWIQINNELIAGADIISNAAEETIPLRISQSYQGYLGVDVQYMSDAVERAGIGFITKEGLKNIGVGVDIRLLSAQASRVFSEGYTFSQRIWNDFNPDGLPIGVHGDYQYRMKNLILTGEAQGRDVIDIADDIQVYVARGKDAVFREGRYGKLQPGTYEFRRRISKRIDWRALRLVRSELNASMQQAGVLEGLVNPAALDLYNWVKTRGNPIDPDGSRNASGFRCIDLEEFNPYQRDDVPGYQHPNCSCHVRPVLRDGNEFLSDLKRWTPGSGNIKYLDDWYNSTYLPAQRNFVEIV